MNDWKVKDTDTGDVWHKDSKAECENAIEEFGDLRDLEIIPPGKTDGGEKEQMETADVAKDTAVMGDDVAEPTNYHDMDLPDDPGIDENPIDYMPGHFVDTIQGVPTLNKMGYAVMAEHFGVTVKAEPVVRASENDFEYAEFKAVAQTKDGTEYSGFGSAHINRQDGDDQYLLNELAETRAMKRAASWALGVGMTAKEEMEGSL